MLRNGATKRRNGAGLAFALIFLLATLLITSNGVSFAKKLASSSGGDNAQVSSLIVDLRGSSSDNLTIDCGQGITAAAYNFAVANTKDGKTAEMSFRYDVIVTLPEAFPPRDFDNRGRSERYGFVGRENGYVYGRRAFRSGQSANARSYYGFFHS